MSQTTRRPPVIPGPPPLPAWARVAPQPPPLVPQKPPLLNPAELERFRNLLVFARSTVEGFFAGKHRSPYRGSSVEFADYKEYVPGDEVDRIDWRAFGRTRRLYVRQYEAETDMTVYLLVDVSASMNYSAPGRQSKFILAAKIAAALAYLMIHQGDKAALALFSSTLNRFLPAAGTRRHLHNLIVALEEVHPASTTGIARALHECHSIFKKRGRLVILSDFWDDQVAVLDALSRFLHRKFEILLLQILHPHELDLPVVDAVRFEDMETGEVVEVEPGEIRAAYRQSVIRKLDGLAREMNNQRIDYALVNTEQPYLDAIEAYLGFRAKNKSLSR